MEGSTTVVPATHDCLSSDKVGVSHPTTTVRPPREKALYSPRVAESHRKHMDDKLGSNETKLRNCMISFLPGHG